jgi:hypothetical protein
MRVPLVPLRLTGFPLLALFVVCFMRPIAAQDVSHFDIVTRRGSDRVQIRTEEDGVLLWVQSPSGISDMVVTRKTKQWPGVVKLRLRLKGLEKLQVISGDLSLGARVNSSQASAGHQAAIGKVAFRCWQDVGKRAQPLAVDSRYWLPIKRIEGLGSKVETVGKAHDFEITLPQALFRKNPAAITVKWIDFYR